MANSFLTQFPVDAADPALDDMQGNILKGHGRQFTFNMFLCFKPGKKNEVRNWLADFSRIFVTTAKQQLDETQRFHDERIPGSIFVSVFLTAAGYAYLGVNAAKTPADPRFAKGMKASKAALQDPDPSTWAPGLNDTLHAMILVADADVHHARSLMRAIRLAIAPEAAVVAVERGVALRNAKGEGIEHNNYVDGISQPVFFTEDLPPTTAHWDPRATPALMAVPDPGGKDAHSLGSYFVFRKLEQNVRGFKSREKAVAKSVFNLPADEATWTEAQKDQAELIGAWAVGRFEDGTPVMTHGTAQNPALGHQENDFNFAAAGSQSKCPFHSHIRKSGPRTDGPGSSSLANEPFNKTKRLVRRGIPFENAPRVRDAAGNLSDDADDQPTGGVGLLFMCYVADIAGQFEFVQQTWVNNPDFSRPGTGPDPLIGQPVNTFAYNWPTGYGASTTKAAPFGDFITMRGGEYFFAPCLSMLQSLKVAKKVSPGTAAKVPNTPVAAGTVKPGDPVAKPGIIDLFIPEILRGHPDPAAALDPMLQLFIPDKADVGAGVVAAGHSS